MTGFKIPDSIKENIIIDGNEHELILRRFKKEDVTRIFSAWNNPQSYRYNSIDWDIDSIYDICEYGHPSEYGMYYMVLEDTTIGEIVGTCRFGDYYWESDDTKMWGFGYCVFREDDKNEYTIDDIRKTYTPEGLIKDYKYQSKGYGQKMLEIILILALKKGIKEVRDGADINNLGSLKVMIKNGFTHLKQKDGNGQETNVDEDIDYEFTLNLENGLPKTLNEDEKKEAYLNLDKIRAVDNLNYKKDKEELDNLHKYKSYLYLIFTKINNLSKCENFNDTFVKIEIDKILDNLAKDEILELNTTIKDREKAWNNSNNLEIIRNLNYLKLVKEVMQEKYNRQSH